MRRIAMAAVSSAASAAASAGAGARPTAYKMAIRGLPPYFNATALKQLLRKHQLEFNNVRIAPKTDFGTVNFATEEARTAAIQNLNGFLLKDRFKLEAAVADPNDINDMKHRRLPVPSGKHRKAMEQREAEEAGLTPTQRIANRVAPYRNKPYEEQLANKSKWLNGILNELRRNMADADVEWAATRLKEKQPLCDVLPCVASPVLTGYRSKCEFSIGTDPLGQTKTVGFVLGSYMQGTVDVAEPTEVPLVPDNVKAVAAAMQEYLCTSPLDAFDRVTHQGVFRNLVVRAAVTGETMALLIVKDANTTPEALEQECQAMVAFWERKRQEGGLRLDHFLVQADNSVSGADVASRPPPRALLGDPQGIITERLSGLSFRVSPDAFFQSNVPCAELLFDVARQWASVEKRSPADAVTLLDICCGTGTIGQVMARHVDKVIGFELVESAVRDAEINAKLNGISNVEYHVGKAETTVAPALTRLGSQRVVGIVDPPRAGLHPSVAATIRNCNKLERLVYIACNFKASQQNILDLCRPTSAKWKGKPFTLVRAVPVDMFPQTDHCEVVLLLARGHELERELAAAAPAAKPSAEEASAEAVAEPSAAPQAEVAPMETEDQGNKQ